MPKRSDAMSPVLPAARLGLTSFCRLSGAGCNLKIDHGQPSDETSGRTDVLEKEDGTDDTGGDGAYLIRGLHWCTKKEDGPALDEWVNNREYIFNLLYLYR